MNEIRNFVQLLPDIATSGQPSPEQFAIIAGQGYEVVINLGMPDHADALADEGSIVADLGMVYIHLPVRFDMPRPGQVKLFCNLLQTLRGRKLWVHCIMNFRVSAFMYHYLTKVEKWSPESSRSPVFEYWQPDETWQALLALGADELGLAG